MEVPTFYIKNFRENGNSKSELEKLLDYKTEKIVLRLLQERGGAISMVAFSGKKNHKNFRDGVILKLNVHPSGAKLDITNREVFLGDQEISEKNDETKVKEISILKALINQKDQEYIIINPLEIDAVEKNIVYEFFTKPDLIGFSTSGIGKLAIKPNPSPPYNGY
ncbi:MAG: hypothetical protein H7Y07_10090 [Pyrinomonadaceae bacterium]|nr:hypothetical protein [Sphingobacteriaceae bacterium]